MEIPASAWADPESVKMLFRNKLWKQQLIRLAKTVKLIIVKPNEINIIAAFQAVGNTTESVAKPENSKTKKYTKRSTI